MSNRLANLTLRAGMWILDRVERRMTRSYPVRTFVHEKQARSTTFAEGCSPYKIILLFFIGAFLGDVTETIYCRLTAGYWMSRSSVVWGPFSIVWGLAIALVTLLLYRYKDKSTSWLFVAGTLLWRLCLQFLQCRFPAARHADAVSPAEQLAGYFTPDAGSGSYNDDSFHVFLSLVFVGYKNNIFLFLCRRHGRAGSGTIKTSLQK